MKRAKKKLFIVVFWSGKDYEVLGLWDCEADARVMARECRADGTPVWTGRAMVEDMDYE